MAHRVKCLYCGQTFDRDKESDVVNIGRRYAHRLCYDENLAKKTAEEQEEEKLEKYICHLFGISDLTPKIRKQISTFKIQNNYSSKGIRKALTYFYEVKGNSIEKANGGIGIVPYIYTEAYNYYYAIWNAKQINEAKPIQQYVAPVEVPIVIPVPHRKDKKKKLFTFLDDGKETNE